MMKGSILTIKLIESIGELDFCSLLLSIKPIKSIRDSKVLRFF